MKKSIKPTLAAILFFVVMALVGIESAHAQINLLEQTHTTDTNPLLATTGPNTVGAGRLQLNASADWNHLHYASTHHIIQTAAMPSFPGGVLMVNSVHYNAYGANLGLRYGIGSILEVNASLGGGFETERNDANISGYDTVVRYSQQRLRFNIGAKVHIYEGHGWVPQMALAAQASELFIRPGDGDSFDYHTPSWVVVMQMRNRLGRRWVLDYSLGIASRENALGQGQRVAAGFSYGLMARFLASDRLMLGAGIEDGNGLFDALFQATPRLQLTAQALVGTGLGGGLFTNSSFIMAGVNWMIH